MVIIIETQPVKIIGFTDKTMAAKHLKVHVNTLNNWLPLRVRPSIIVAECKVFIKSNRGGSNNNFKSKS